MDTASRPRSSTNPSSPSRWLQGTFGVFGAVLVTLAVACGGDSGPEEPVANITVVSEDIAASPSPAASVGIAPTASPTTAAPTATPAPRIYIVQSGDTLTSICTAEVPEMQPDACIPETVTLNELASPSSIFVGQELVLPGTAAQSPAEAPAAGTTPAAGGGQPQPTASSGGGTAAGFGAVTRVIDGDTIEVNLGTPVLVRLMGVDAPEAGAQPVPCYGPEAAAFTRQLLEGQTVTLEQDVTNTDEAGRLLRYVYLPNGQMLNELLLAEGYGRVWVLPPNTRYTARFLDGAQAARSAGKGIWSAC